MNAGHDPWDLRKALKEYPHFFVPRQFARGESIFEEGGPPEAVYLLSSGIVKGVKYSPKGEPFTMEIVFAGQLFGMLAVMDKKPYPISTVALKDCEVFWISAASFNQLMRTYPDFAAEIYAEIGNHIRFSQKMRSLFKESMEKRIAYVLSLLFDSLGDRIDFRREDIAEMVGCTEETSIRILMDFKRKKIIRAGRNRIEIADRDRLMKLIDSDPSFPS